jgi:hypothetical protein
MNVSNFVFYRSLRSFLPFGPSFCGVQGACGCLEMVATTQIKCQRTFRTLPRPWESTRFTIEYVVFGIPTSTTPVPGVAVIRAEAK